MPKSKKRISPKHTNATYNKQSTKTKYKRKSIQIRRFRSGTFLFGVMFVSELFIVPKKDRYLQISFIKWELRLGRFYG